MTLGVSSRVRVEGRIMGGDERNGETRDLGGSSVGMLKSLEIKAGEGLESGSEPGSITFSVLELVGDCNKKYG